MIEGKEKRREERTREAKFLHLFDATRLHEFTDDTIRLREVTFDGDDLSALRTKGMGKG